MRQHMTDPIHYVNTIIDNNNKVCGDGIIAFIEQYVNIIIGYATLVLQQFCSAWGEWSYEGFFKRKKL